MTIPVYWVSWHDDIIPRGYADQGMLEAILDRSLWHPPNAYTFEHYEVRSDFPQTDGAVVILPARHHASPTDVGRLKSELSRLDWYVLILSGDEEWVFPYQEFPETETSRVWIMQPRPEHTHLMSIPGGWYPGTHDYLDGDYPSRSFDWFFAGQVTHERRKQLSKVLRNLDGGSLLETKGYLQGNPKEWYFDQMRQAKVIPCPSGPMTVDTARAFEAMEAGCIPVVDILTPRGEDYDYWELLLEDEGLLPRIRDWNDFPTLLDDLSSVWTRYANRVFSFWQQYKRDITLKLDDDIADVRLAAGYEDFSPTAPCDAITAIVTTSPTEQHPDTSAIEQVIDSIREQLPDCEIIITFDGVRPEDEDLRKTYEEYTNRLLWLCNYRWRNVVPLVREEWGHQANSVRDALALVDTPYILFCEHDTPLEGEIDWELVMYPLEDGANLIRFHFDVGIHPDHAHLFGEEEGGFLQTFVWWQRPHVASTDFYRVVLSRHFTPESRTMIEDLMHGVVHSDLVDHGWGVWDRWRFYTYAPDMGNLKRSGHLDTRGSRSKYEMRYR